jgi:drug/metabolite transporter (DMT)-like permease
VSIVHYLPSVLSAPVRHMLLSTFFFAVMNGCIKKIGHLPAWELVAFRSLTTFVITIWIIRGMNINWLGNSRLTLFLRGLFGSLALYFFFRSLTVMPLATAVTIQFTSPIFTTLIGIAMNNEKVKWIQWVFLLISFSGIVLLKGVQTTISTEAFFIGLASAGFSGLAYNMIRRMKEAENPHVIVLHFQIIGMLLGGISLCVDFALPQADDMLYILAMGGFAYLGQIHLTRALQGERLGIITSLNYLGVFYSLILGWIFFHEPIDAKTLMAMTLVVSGVVLNVFWGNKNETTA